jgi:hypothetical protein
MPKKDTYREETERVERVILLPCVANSSLIGNFAPAISHAAALHCIL